MEWGYLDESKDLPDFSQTLFAEIDSHLLSLPFLHQHNLMKMRKNQTKRVVPEIVHQPGIALQLDWGKLQGGLIKDAEY